MIKMLLIILLSSQAYPQLSGVNYRYFTDKNIGECQSLTATATDTATIRLNFIYSISLQGSEETTPDHCYVYRSTMPNANFEIIQDFAISPRCCANDPLQIIRFDSGNNSGEIYYYKVRTGYLSTWLSNYTATVVDTTL
jgi:hypothetical protein